MSELTVEAEGLRVVVRAESPDADVWAISRAAFEAAHNALNNYSTSHFPKGGVVVRNVSARIREIAREVLADGRHHPRKEIVKAVREAGLNPQSLNKVLEGHFEASRSSRGTAVYRDPGVSPPVPVGTITELGTLGGNGDGS